ncbi:MAG: hypothetical protein JNL74_08940 [Fibrobacteres bacterium]|nr:hypothetical protein [Fibrobacterota bacterium]
MIVKIFRFLLLGVISLFVLKIISRNVNRNHAKKAKVDEGRRVNTQGLSVKDADFVEVKDRI